MSHDPHDRRWLEPVEPALRFVSGMAILATVFVVSQGLLFVHELTSGQPAATRGR